MYNTNENFYNTVRTSHITIIYNANRKFKTELFHFEVKYFNIETYFGQWQ